MTHITKNLSDAILQALYDTGHRFNSCWRQIIQDIAWALSNQSDIGSMGSCLVAEDLKGFHFRDFGYRVPPYFGPGWAWCIHKPMTRELLHTVELSDVITPWSSDDIVIGERWGKVGPKVAWFLERIRELNFIGTEDHREFRYGSRMDHQSEWWWDTVIYMIDPANPLRRSCTGCLDEITWSVLVQYLSFIREMSNWTMPLMPGPDTPSRDCIDHYRRLMNGEVSGMGEGHVYECFNQEQGEELPSAWETIMERVPTDASSNVRDFPRREHVEPDLEFGIVRLHKKEMVHEILGIIEDNVVEGKINEQKYKELSELLMEFHQSIRQ